MRASLIGAMPAPSTTRDEYDGGRVLRGVALGILLSLAAWAGLARGGGLGDGRAGARGGAGGGGAGTVGGGGRPPPTPAGGGPAEAGRGRAPRRGAPASAPTAFCPARGSHES